MASQSVIVRREPVVLPTYTPFPPDKNPMFLEKRVYQGSSGRVYPLPFYNRIAETAENRGWDAVHIENDFIKVMVLPELGGRIHIGQDKTNGYDFFYRQDVIKPALVGLAGPWISGGVEFNWPQHHRPATFMPVDVEIEEHADGSKTIWLSDHDPMERMKGMHGVCLHPDRAAIEVKMRAYNRTPYVQTFLWWANVATRVHEAYQSFFPPDVTAVADHAKRAMSRFPHCEGRYYGVDYAGRARDGVPAHEMPANFVPPHGRPDGAIPGVPNYAPDDLSWYANIPVPTSYMCLGSKQDFSGGYDHFARAGLVQVANHHISPGKKQWTWGNHEFGYAWDRNLTDRGGPYIELMLGVYTDNQPDFTFLQPGETKTWSVWWYPIREIGPAQAANAEAAVSLQTRDRQARIGVASTRAQRGARIELWHGERRLQRWTRDLAPDRSFVTEAKLPPRVAAREISVRVFGPAGELIRTTPPPTTRGELPPAATEPPPPSEIATNDELFVTGLHLSQYRHATRSGVDYWREALRRDPADARCNTALGTWHLRRGEFALAETHLRRAIERLTLRNPNPADGEPYYQLGLALRFLSRDGEAYDAFYKAAWNQAWQAASYHALAEIDCTRGDWATALAHLDQSLRQNTDNLRARDLRVLVLRRLGRVDEADAQLAATLALDPLDWWARHLRGDALRCDTQTRLDLAIDLTRVGFFKKAVALLEEAKPESGSGTAPLVAYYLADLHERLGAIARAARAARRAAAASPDYCFPARLEEIAILERALARNPRDARAAYYLGNLFYDRRRYTEAIALWERSARLLPDFSIVWRNLGIAYFNVEQAPAKARRAYERAFRANPRDARLFYERDQLWKRTGVPARTRLRQFERHRALVDQRDDAAIELCALYNQTGQPQKALAILTARRFQPWEGGEGQALGQHVRTHLALGRQDLTRGTADAAVTHFEQALAVPENLGEARHLLANDSDIRFWLGVAYAAAGRTREAKTAWQRAAAARGDFQEMSVRAFSEMTYFSARALERLGRRDAARRLLRELGEYAQTLARTPAKIDYFATSLPTMLLFEDDLNARQQTTACFLQAQSAFGLGRRAEARRLLRRVLERDPSHAGAADLLAER
jgi:tetratricopeptide (TPR) repeat protein